MQCINIHNEIHEQIFTLLLAEVTSLSTGGATIVSKSSYPLTVNSTPSNASIVITDKKGKEVFKGQTPTTVKLKSSSGFFSKAEYQVKFSAPGYSEKIIPITSKINGWYWGNVLFGGIVGMLIIDWASGAMFKLDAKELNESLSKSTASVNEGELRILGLNEVPKNLRDKLVRIN